MAGAEPTIVLEAATLELGGRRIWSDLDVAVAPGELLAVLGPNGAGKSTLLKVLLGLLPLTAGRALVAGRPPRRGDHRIGYVPQQKGFDPSLPIRGRDLVRFGLDGHRRGLPWRSRARDAAVDAAIAAVGAQAYAHEPLGRLSGGEQQRLRVAQALVGDPGIVLCDEPLLSLDLNQQQVVSDLIARRCREHGASALFVTHDLNPILGPADRVLYLVDGRAAIGPPAEVMTSDRLTALYGTPIEVLDVHGRLVVVGAHDGATDDSHAHHHDDHHRRHDHAPGVRR